METFWAILILTVPYLAPLLSLKSRGGHVVQVRNYHNTAHNMQNQKQELRCGARGGSSGQSGVVDEEEDGPKGWKEGKAQHTGRRRGRERGIGAVSDLLFPFTALWWHLVKGLFFFFECLKICFPLFRSFNFTTIIAILWTWFFSVFFTLHTFSFQGDRGQRQHKVFLLGKDDSRETAPCQTQRTVDVC